MADAVLQHYDLGPQINASGFAEAVSSARNADMRQQELKDRRAERDQNRKDNTSKYFSDELDPKKIFTGTVYDQHNTEDMAAILQKANLYADQGKGISDIQMLIGKDVNELNTRYTTEKQINKNIEDYAGRFKGQKGFNVEAILSHAKGMAFQNIDPETGKYSGIKDSTQLDPNTNWVEEAIKQHPEDVSNADGLSQALQQTKRDKANPRGNVKVGQDEYKTGYDSQLYPFQKFSSERDQYGNPKNVEIGAETATDNGKPIVDEEGQPMKIVPESVFNYYNDKSGVAPYLNAQAKKAFQETGMPLPKEGDPKWDIMKRHELYKYLNENAGVDYSPIAEKTSQSQRIQMLQDPRYISALKAGSEARSEGNIQGKIDMGVPLPGTNKGKVNNTVADGVASVYQGNYDAPVVDYKGEKYEDITGAFPKGSLKFGKSDKNTYNKVLFDPAKGTITTVYTDPASLKDEVKTFSESQMGQFVGSHSEANGGTVAINRKALQNAGFKDGSFTGRRSDKGESLQAAAQKEREDKVDAAIDNDKLDDLKKINTPDGVIKSVSTHGIKSFFGGDEVSIELTKDGKTTTKSFKTKAALANYLKAGSTKPAAATATKAVLD